MICRSAMGARSPIAAIATGMMPPAAMPATMRTTVSISNEPAKVTARDRSASAPRQVAIVLSLPSESAIGPRNG